MIDRTADQSVNYYTSPVAPVMCGNLRTVNLEGPNVKRQVTAFADIYLPSRPLPSSRFTWSRSPDLTCQ